MRYETLDHAVELPRDGVCARRLARFERDFARWLQTAYGRGAALRSKRTLARSHRGEPAGRRQWR